MFVKHLKIPLMVLLLIGTTFFAKAQDSIKLSLQDAITRAMQNNTNILNSEIDLKIAQKKIWETTASGLPQISAKAAYTFYPKVPSLPATFFDPNADPNASVDLLVQQNVVTDITVSQLIFSGSYFVGLQATKVYYNLAKQTDEKTRLDVFETVVNTYRMLQLAKESRDILQQNLENINKTLEDVSEMNKQGFLEKTDVDQLQVTANTIRNAINEIDSNLDIGYRLLKIQTGIEDTDKIELIDQTESDESLTGSSLKLGSISFNIDKNVDFQLIQTSEKVALLDLKLAKSSFLPTVSGFYNHTEKLKAPLFDFAPKDLIGVNLTLPIFSSGMRLSIVSQKKMTLEKAQNTLKFVSKSIQMQASQYQNDIRLKLEKYLNQKKSKELSDNIYQSTLEKYKLGMASSMDLMNSQNQYLTNLTNYYQSIYNLQLAKSKLEKLYNINQDFKH